MAHVLIVDDEADLASLVDFNLKQEGLETTVVHTGAEAISMAKARRPDLVVLDLMLPDISGKEVCRRLRSDATTRDLAIIMLTARGEETDRVAGFEVGADDYVTKPFSPRELVLRVRALLRRARISAEASLLKVGLLSVDTAAHRAWVGDDELVLEFAEPVAEDSLAVVISTAGPVTVQNIHTHAIAQIVGLQDMLEDIGQRLADLERMLPRPGAASANTAG
jgi:two-component system phosphate regulon response regulator PhoB